MSIEAKVTFVNALKNQLSKSVPESMMRSILIAVSDQLEGYDIQIQESKPDNDDLLGAYLDAMQIQGRSQKTIDRYRYVISRMLNEIRISTRAITVYHLRQYLAGEKSRGIADSTLEGTRQIFSGFFNWLQRESLIETNPVANLGTIKCVKKIKSVFSDVEIEQMKFLCKSLRDRAIIMFLQSTGCRIGEVTRLNRSDVDLTSLECTVLGKGNKERTVYLSPIAGMVLQEYLDQREDDSPALFVGKGSNRMTPGGIRHMLTVLESLSGVEHIHPHKFRRTLATNLIRHGMPIQEIASILGHDKLDTTMGYVVLDKSDIKNAYRKYA